MSDFTAEEIATAVEDAGDGWHSLGHVSSMALRVNLRGKTVTVERVGGCMPHEGGEENVSVIVKVGTQFFEKSGYYASHYGTDWDGPVSEVTPREKMIIVYEAVPGKQAYIG